MCITMARAHAFFDCSKQLVPHIMHTAGLSRAARFKVLQNFENVPGCRQSCGLLTWNREEKNALKLAASHPTGKPQKELHRIVREHFFPVQLPLILEQRALRHLQAEGHSVDIHSEQWQFLVDQLACFSSPYMRMQVLRILLNGVCIPGRFQESRACILCGGGKADLRHANNCHELVQLITQVAPSFCNRIQNHQGWILRVIHDFCTRKEQARDCLSILAFTSLLLSEAYHAGHLNFGQLATAVSKHYGFTQVEHGFLAAGAPACSPSAPILDTIQLERRERRKTQHKEKERAAMSVPAGLTIGEHCRGILPGFGGGGSWKINGSYLQNESVKSCSQLSEGFSSVIGAAWQDDKSSYVGAGVALGGAGSLHDSAVVGPAVVLCGFRGHAGPGETFSAGLNVPSATSEHKKNHKLNKLEK